jgi:galactokinase/mevalonate kinase-like predicted kinase
MKFELTIPARINVLGNPSDATEGDFATLSAAVDMRAGARIEPAEGITLEVRAPSGELCDLDRRESFYADQIPLPYTGGLDLVKGAVNRLYRYSEEFREKVHREGFRLGAWTRVPRQSGLGGSSLFVLVALGALRARYGLDRRVHNDYVLAEMTQKVESQELGITCGYADRYVPLFGGLAYVDYRGKLHQRPIGEEPYATYERLDHLVEELPLIAVSTGVVRDSGDVHGRMRPRYLQEYRDWSTQGGEMPPMVQFMVGAWETAWQGKRALLEGDLESFGALMNRNHQLVDAMMNYCGFVDGAGWANNRFIDVALETGALGAKLTGAGGGGSVFALVRPGEEGALEEAWQRAAVEAELENAAVYRPRISRQGLSARRLEGGGE